MRLDLVRECGAAKICHVCPIGPNAKPEVPRNFIIVHPFPSKVFLGLSLQVMPSQSAEVRIGAKTAKRLAQSMPAFLRLRFGLIPLWLIKSTYLRTSTSTLIPTQQWGLGPDVIQLIFKACFPLPRDASTR